MKVIFLTIVKDGMPFITYHYPEFRRLPFEWEWHVSEGTAAAENCTSWCRPIPPGLSSDGTTEYLNSVAQMDPRVRLYRNEMWRGKQHMVNEPLQFMFEPFLLLQVDSDEIWTADQITRLRQLFLSHPKRNAAFFFCRYFVGPDVVITSRNTFGNQTSYEWHRAWRCEPGMRFKSHEPPVMNGLVLNPFSHAETEKAGLVFDHFAYATEAQVAFKESYYGSVNNQNGDKYRNAVTNWRRLQANENWPVTDLQKFLPWVGPGVTAERL